MQLWPLHPEIGLAYELVQQFTQILRTCTGEKLNDWLEIAGFVNSKALLSALSERKQQLSLSFLIHTYSHTKFSSVRDLFYNKEGHTNLSFFKLLNKSFEEGYR